MFTQMITGTIFHFPMKVGRESGQDGRRKEKGIISLTGLPTFANY